MKPLVVILRWTRRLSFRLFIFQGVGDGQGLAHEGGGHEAHNHAAQDDGGAQHQARFMKAIGQGQQRQTGQTVHHEEDTWEFCCDLRWGQTKMKHDETSYGYIQVGLTEPSYNWKNLPKLCKECAQQPKRVE